MYKNSINNNQIKNSFLIPTIIGIGIFILSLILFFLEMDQLDIILLPFFTIMLLCSCIFLLLNIFCNDKFISKIFLFSLSLHFIFLLFWHLFKYYMLGYHLPTENIFVPFTVDNDGLLYHMEGVYIAKNFSFEVLKEKFTGGPFPKFIGLIYYYFKYNPFLPCLLNSVVSGFTAIFIYLIGKSTLTDIRIAKLYSLFSIFNFAHIINTSVLIRDSYIVFFIYLTIYISYLFYKSQNLLYLLMTTISLYCLYLFRPYAAFILFFALVTTFILINLKISLKKHKLKTNILGLILVITLPIIIVLFVYLVTQAFALLDVFSVEDLIEIRETAYPGGETDTAYDFGALYNIFFLLPFVIGYIFLFFAPFPWTWYLARRLIYIPDMSVLYLFLPSFFRNIKQIFMEKKYFPTVCFFAIIFMFSIYCITLGNTGAIHRLRGPFIPMIYLIAMTHPNKFLSRILNFIKKCNVV